MWILRRLCFTSETRYHFFRNHFGIRGGLKAQDAWRAVWRRATNRDLKAPPKLGNTSATDQQYELLWSEKLQNTFYRQHSEIHALYVTSLVMLGLCVWRVSHIVLRSSGGVGFDTFTSSDQFHETALIGGVGGILALIAGIADVLVSRQECLVLHQNKAAVATILRESGLIRSEALSSDHDTASAQLR
jgi:hypothetical protein